jgi:hypothetical protein
VAVDDIGSKAPEEADVSNREPDAQAERIDVPTEGPDLGSKDTLLTRQREEMELHPAWSQSSHELERPHLGAAYVHGTEDMQHFHDGPSRARWTEVAKTCSPQAAEASSFDATEML